MTALICEDVLDLNEACWFENLFVENSKQRLQLNNL